MLRRDDSSLPVSSALQRQPRPAGPKSLTPDIETAIRSAQSYLFRLQKEDGHWCGELEGDTILESEYGLLLFFLGMSDSPKLGKLAEYIRRKQADHGGWAIYPGGPVEVSASVKAYFFLKLVGDAPEAPHMVRARHAILRAGGVEATNSYTKLNLATFGQISWEECPPIPPEMILLPRWFWFNIYEMSSWTRPIVIPLSIVWAHKPYRAVPPWAAIPELFCGRQPPRHRPEHTGVRTRLWREFFLRISEVINTIERRTPVKPLRQMAIERAQAWMHERLRMSDGLGAIFPPIINTAMAFHCLGYATDHPYVQGQLHELEKLSIDEAETLRLQPCFSPVWDTGMVLHAMVESGVPADHADLARAADWLLHKEVTHAGDWQIKCPDAPIGGWYFEYANEFCPDCDDTAKVLLATSRLASLETPLADRLRAARSRGLAWLLQMQNSDGGWAAFDKDCCNEALTLIPFADHNAMIDPSCEDITGRVLETIAREGYDVGSPVVKRAIAYLQRKQEPDGTWYGRWGANYIYGTWLVLQGLRAVGVDMTQERYQRPARWLREQQNADGGWGETLRSYDEPTLKGQGPSTAAQTAWSLMALFASGDHDSTAVRRGVDYLLRTQQADGSWHDAWWTGTGFPRVFYLCYHLYDKHFPLLALATYRRRLN